MGGITHPRPPAAVHVDLDGAAAIYAVHGWPYPYDRDPLFETGLANLLALLDETAVRATLFVIADDLADPRKRALLETAVARGHAIGCHAATHRKLTTLDPAQQRREVIDSRARIAAALGVPVAGFRAPYFDLDGEVLRLVAEAGYAYDSSTFPGKQVCLNGRWHAAQPVPHRWPGLSALAELPLPAHAPLPLPFHPSYSLVVGSWYFRLGLRRFRRRGAPLIFLFHLTDLADPLPPAMLPTPQTRFFTLSYQSGPRKRARCRAMLDIVRRDFRVMDTLELLTETL